MRRSGVLIRSLITTSERRRSSSLMMPAILHPNPPITSHFAVDSMLGTRHDSWLSPLCSSSLSVYFSSVPEVASSPRIEEESGVNLQSKMDENGNVDLDNNYTKNDYSDRNGDGNVNGHHRNISSAEAKRLLRLVNVEALKKRLETMEGKEVIDYASLISECQAIGVARSAEEAAAFTKVLDEAGVVLVFRDKVYLHPDKVAELVTNAMPLALAPKDDPRIEELKNLQKMKEEIDKQAHRQVRGILWTGLGFSVAQVGLFFRLTFWEFSWDVMEPITFFTTTTGLVVGYAYFLITSRDPTYEDVLKRLFKSRQRKIIQKLKFNEARFDELQRQLKFPCKCASDVEALIKG